MKTAIIQCADTGPLESIVVMLRSAGYECYMPSDAIKRRLRDLGCDTILDVKGLVENWGYDYPMHLPEAPLAMLDTCSLYVDIKAHRNGPKIWQAYPRLKERTLWYRINGGEPEHVIKDGQDYGDETNLTCPILTPNLWYQEEKYAGKAYSVWPPFHRFNDYLDRNPRGGDTGFLTAPICLIHNVTGWGYGDLISRVGRMGVKIYGRGSPDGLLQHRQIPNVLSRTKCMVHLKGSDAPGYALYEALASACPVIVSRSLIWRNRMEDLFVPGETCLAFDKPSHDACDVDKCAEEISEAIERLSFPRENELIGNAGRHRLMRLMWSEKKPEDTASLKAFMERNYDV